MTLSMSGPTALREIPSIKADIYLGGKIPANPATELLRMAMHMPNNIIMVIVSIQAISSGKK